VHVMELQVDVADELQIDTADELQIDVADELQVNTADELQIDAADELQVDVAGVTWEMGCIGSPSHRSAPCIVDWPCVLSIGPPSCRLAHHLVEWPRISSISSVRSRLAHRIVDGCVVSSMGASYRRWAHRIVDGHVVSSIGLLSGQSAGRDVTGPFVAFRVVVCVRQGGQWWQGMRKGYNGATTKVVAHPCDALPGPPISWVPPLVPLSLRISFHRARRRRAHIPQERGGAPDELPWLGANWAPR